MISRRIVLSYGFLLVAACHSDRTQDESPPEVVSEDFEAPPQWDVEAKPALSIGQADGGAAYLLSNVVGAVRLPAGDVVVANRGSQELRYYSPEGTHLTTSGRPGDGPGEFRWLDWIGRTEDSVLAWDAFARRVSVYGPDGAFVRSVQLRDLEIPFPQAVGVTDREIILRPRSDPDAAPAGSGEYTDSVTYLRFSIDSGAPTGRAGPFLDAERFVARTGRLNMSAPVIFGREGRLAIHPDGMLTAVSDRLEITVRDRAGAPVRTIRSASPSAQPTRADLAAARARVRRDRADVVRAFPQMAPVLERLVERLPHRAALPAISAMEVARDGSVWVRGYAPPDAPDVRWTVFAADGRRLAFVDLPADVQVFEIGVDWLLGRSVDDDGVERVVLHHILRPEPE